MAKDPAGAIVGAGGVLGVYDGTASVMLAVVPRARGLGVGQALFDAIEDSLTADVTSISVLRSDSLDPRTSRFLAARGFARIDEGAWTWVTDLTDPSLPAPASARADTAGIEVAVHDVLTGDRGLADEVAAIEAQWHTDRGYPPPEPSEFIERVQAAGDIGGFVVVASIDGSPTGFVTAEPTWADGVLSSRYCVVDRASRRRGLARMLKAAQREAARARGWRVLTVDVPGPGHPMGRIAAELGARGLDGPSWTRSRS